MQYHSLSDTTPALKRPSFRTPHTMDPRTWFRDLTGYFLYILFVATLGPLLFGFHLVMRYAAYLRCTELTMPGRTKCARGRYPMQEGLNYRGRRQPPTMHADESHPMGCCRVNIHAGRTVGCAGGRTSGWPIWTTQGNAAHDHLLRLGTGL
jgi:hypothetical protein